MSAKARVINDIIARERGYVNDPLDPGGETNLGITIAVARANGYRGAMRDLPREVAFAIYARRYWDALRLDDVERIAPAVAAELADTGVNMGTGTAARFFQTALNALNDRGGLYADIGVDGDVGDKTIAAFNAYARTRSRQGRQVMIDVMVAALNAQQGARYIDLCQGRMTMERFAFGWFAHRVAKPALETGTT